MVEFERAARHGGQRHRVGRRADLRHFVEQLGKAAGGARAAQKVAIDLGQCAERAGDQAAGQHEGGDRCRR